MSNKFGTNYKDIKYCYICGYGSLMNKVSRESNFSTYLPGLPVFVSSEFGFKRVFDGNKLIIVSNNNYNTAFSSVIFKFPVNLLNLLDRRESSYRRVLLPHNYIYTPSRFFLNKSLPVYIYLPNYIPKIRSISKSNYNISYLNIVIEGLKEFGSEFLNLFFETTYNLPRIKF